MSSTGSLATLEVGGDAGEEVVAESAVDVAGVDDESLPHATSSEAKRKVTTN
jgi:hypothetical protein